MERCLRLATSIQQGVVTASLLVRKIGSYPRQNGLALALRELGKIERTLFMLDWFADPVLRRRVTAGLNKGEARNTLARAVYFNRLGEMRDCSIESQSHRASGLTLVTAAIIFWNTVYIDRAVEAMKEQGYSVDENLLQHLSPLGWEHIGRPVIMFGNKTNSLKKVSSDRLDQWEMCNFEAGDKPIKQFEGYSASVIAFSGASSIR